MCLYMHTKPHHTCCTPFFSKFHLCCMQCSLVLYALNMPTYAFQYFPYLSAQMREKNIWYVANLKHMMRHLLNTSKKRRYLYTSEVRVFMFSAGCALVGHWRNILRPYDFKQLAHHKTPNTDPGGGYFLVNIIHYYFKQMGEHPQRNSCGEGKGQ